MCTVMGLAPPRPRFSVRQRSPAACPAGSRSACSTPSPIRSTGPGATTLEPATNYGVVRGNQDFRGGDGSVGFILTAVNRSLDADERAVPPSKRVHRRDRRALAVQGAVRGVGLGRPESSGGRYRGDRADTAGSGSSVPASGRPARRSISTRTSLSGSNQEIRFAKVGGKRLHFETAYQRRTPGFEINDIGFLRQADQQDWTSWANLAFNSPTGSSSSSGGTSTTGSTGRRGAADRAGVQHQRAHQFTNRWWLHMGGTVGQVGATYCDRCARGGPAVRQDPYIAPWITIEGDDRRPLVPSCRRTTTGATRAAPSRIELDARARSQGLQPVHDLAQRAITTTTETTCSTSARSPMRPAAPHYTFAHLEQKTLSLDLAPGLHLHPTTSLQVYASPFVSKGTYSDVREIADAAGGGVRGPLPPVCRSRPWPAIRAGSTSSSSARTWCSAGSTGRARRCSWSGVRGGRDPPIEGSADVPGRSGRPVPRRANDTFLVKVSYWLTR